MSNSIGHGGVTNNPITNSPYFKGDFESAQVTPSTGDFMLFEDGDTMIYENGDTMIYE